MNKYEQKVICPMCNKILYNQTYHECKIKINIWVIIMTGYICDNCEKEGEKPFGALNSSQQLGLVCKICLTIKKP